MEFALAWLLEGLFHSPLEGGIARVGLFFGWGVAPQGLGERVGGMVDGGILACDMLCPRIDEVHVLVIH